MKKHKIPSETSVLRSAKRATQEKNITRSPSFRREHSSQSTADSKGIAEASARVHDHPPCTTEVAATTGAKVSGSGKTPANFHGIQHESDNEVIESSHPSSTNQNYFRRTPKSSSLIIL